MKLVSGWCDWLVKRPQGQHHKDIMAAGIASAICTAQGMKLPPEHFVFYEHKPEVELSQAQIDVGVAKLFALASKATPKAPEEKGLDG
ncbi:MAG: hypothetical protein V4719_00795 [Planctomycetota bacterium]